MEHVPAVGQFLRQCLACLRPEGKLIVSVPSHDGFMGSELNSILDLPPHHITQWSDRCMAAVASVFELKFGLPRPRRNRLRITGSTTCTRSLSTLSGSVEPTGVLFAPRVPPGPSTGW